MAGRAPDTLTSCQASRVEGLVDVNKYDYLGEDTNEDDDLIFSVIAAFYYHSIVELLSSLLSIPHMFAKTIFLKETH